MKQNKVFILENRGVLYLHGEDVEEFLQNIITNDIDEMLEDEKINKLEMNEFIRRLNDTINKWSKNNNNLTKSYKSTPK